MSARAANEPSEASPHRSAGARLVALLGAALLLTLGTIGLLAALLAPALGAVTSGQTADGRRGFGIGDGVGAAGPGAAITVTPAAGWWVQPEATGGVLLRSPDRLLTVTLQAVSSAEAAAALADAGASADPLRSELLANGAVVRHRTAEEQLVAVIEAGDAELLLAAQVAPGRELDDYRPSIGLLLESIAPAAD